MKLNKKLMCQFIESIRIDNQVVKNLTLHKKRIEKTFQTIFNTNPTFDIDSCILLPKDNNIYKFRIVYGFHGVVDSSLTPYLIKPVKNIAIKICNDIEYNYKYLNRDSINNLTKNKGKCDDILIVKNGFLTDTSIGNIALFDGNNWVTPSAPLLKGTKREQLVINGTLVEKNLHIADLRSFSNIRIFNSMIDWGEIELKCADSINYEFI